MSVELTYFDGRSEGTGAFIEDLKEAIDAAMTGGDAGAVQKLRSFLLDYFEVRLASKTARQLEDHLAKRKAWKETQYWNVYRVPDTPSVCFAVKIGTDRSIRLIPIGACYGYPGGDPEAWWRETIEPRVRSLT